MRQIAVFGAVGIASALTATRLILPSLIPHLPRRTVALDGAQRFMTWALPRLSRHRRWLLLIPLAALVVWLAALPGMRWTDDPNALASIDPDVLAQDARVRALVSTDDPGRFVVAAGKDWESALAVNDRVFQVLVGARDRGELRDFGSLHRLLWSADLQRRNQEQLRASPDLAARLSRAMEAQGFRPGVFAEFSREIARPPPPPVRPEDLLHGGLASMIRGFYLTTRDEIFIITRLGGVTDPAAARSRLSEIPGATYFDQTEYLQRAYGGFRASVLQIVVVSLLAVLVLVALRYRRLRSSLAALLPGLFAGATSLAVIALAGVTLNMLHLLALILILSMGVDYGVFVVEAVRGGDDIGIAMVGTAIACATTILSFGMLAMSENPALGALGLTTAIGVTLSLVFTPMALVLLGDHA
jgi:predicted exporter